MINFHIIVPSHITRESRLIKLDKTLQSLISQYTDTSFSYKIHAQMSFDNIDLWNKFQPIYNKYNSVVQFHLSNDLPILKEYQFYKIHKIYNHIQSLNTKNNWFLFCDDDDEYHTQRLEIFSQHIKKFKKTHAFFEDTDRGFEYPYFCLSPTILFLFFSFLSKNNYYNLLNDPFCDVIFRRFLAQLKFNEIYDFQSIDEKLYFYQDNQDSFLHNRTSTQMLQEAVLKYLPHSFSSNKKGINEILSEKYKNSNDKNARFLYKVFLYLYTGENKLKPHQIKIIHTFQSEYKLIHDSIISFISDIKNP